MTLACVSNMATTSGSSPVVLTAPLLRNADTGAVLIRFCPDPSVLTQYLPCGSIVKPGVANKSAH